MLLYKHFLHTMWDITKRVRNKKIIAIFPYKATNIYVSFQSILLTQ